MSLYGQEQTLAVIDFETLSTKSDAKVLSLAITYFDVTEQNTIAELMDNTRSWNFDLVGQEHRHESEETLAFWEGHRIAWKAHRLGHLYKVQDVLEELKHYCELNNIVYLIGNGSTFDNALLKDLCEDFGKEYPIEFWGDLDLRTMRWLSEYEKPLFPIELTPHIAEHDCVYEAILFQSIFNELKGKNNG